MHDLAKQGTIAADASSDRSTHPRRIAKRDDPGGHIADHY